MSSGGEPAAGQPGRQRAAGHRPKGTWAGRLRQTLVQTFTWSQWRPLVTRSDQIDPGWKNLAWLEPPDRRSWADPFPLRQNGRWFVFVEEKLPGQPGHIAVLELDEQLRVRHSQPVLCRPFHLSYPFLLRHQGQLFMLPEAGASGRLDAYRCIRFPDQWEQHAALMEEVRIADATLVEHAGRWWLFAALDPGTDAPHALMQAGSTVPASADAAGPSAPLNNAARPAEQAIGYPAAGADAPTVGHRPASAPLHLFSADSPLSTSWTPHPRNPVVTDPRCSRPAGRIFSRAGQLFRPAQDGTVRYGYAVRVQRILRLDPTAYAEEEAFSVPPVRGQARAVHTFNQEAGLTVIDAKRRRLRGL